MSSPGQKRGTCGQVMALFDSHKKCARCREKGVGDDPCVKKLECQICKGFTPAQVQQLATPTYKSWIERGEQKKTTETASSATPTVVDPSDVTLLGWVHTEKPSSVESTPKKRRSDGSPKSGKRKHSSKPTSEDLKSLDDKWSERFSRLEALLLSKSFAVVVEPVRPSTVVTREHPFFDPGASSNVVSSDLVTEGTGPSLVQTTGIAVQLSATQPPLGVPGMNAVQDVSKSATHPVQGPGTSDVATQPLQAPCAERATQPLQAPSAGTATQLLHAPGAGPEVLPTYNDPAQLDQSLSGGRTAEIAGESASKPELDREPASPASANVQGELLEDSIDQDLSEEANYRETIRGVRSFMGWHQIPNFDSASSSLDDNPFAGSRVKPTGKVSVKLPEDEWLCQKFERLNLTVPKGYPSRNNETGGLLRDKFVKPPRSSKWYEMHTDKKDSASTTVCNWSLEPAKLNSTFSRVARRSLPSAPASRTISQDTLRRWERAFREQSVMCNQAAGLSRCLTKVQDSMVTHLKTLRVDKAKGKAAERKQEAVEELEYLVTFNRSISQAMQPESVAGVKDSVHVSSKKESLNPSPVTSKSKTVVLHVDSCVANVHSVTGLPQRKGVNPNYCHYTEIKYVKDVSLLIHVALYRNICLLKSNKINILRVYPRSATVLVHFKG